MLDRIFGFPAKLTIEVDGEEVDVTKALTIAEALDRPAVIVVDASRLLTEIAVHREVKRRLAMGDH